VKLRFCLYFSKTMIGCWLLAWPLAAGCRTPTNQQSAVTIDIRRSNQSAIDNQQSAI
jgi:hypothetical protein